MIKLIANVLAILIILWGVGKFILGPIGVGLIITNSASATAAVICSVVVLISWSIPWLLRR